MAIDDENEKTPTENKKTTSEIRELFYELGEFAAEFGLTKRTLSNWNRRRIGPPRTKIPGSQKIYYRKSSVLKWLVDREQRQPPQAPIRSRRGR